MYNLCIGECNLLPKELLSIFLLLDVLKNIMMFTVADINIYFCLAYE